MTFIRYNSLMCPLILAIIFSYFNLEQPNQIKVNLKVDITIKCYT